MTETLFTRCLVCEEPVDFFLHGDLEQPQDTIVLKAPLGTMPGQHIFAYLCDECAEVKGSNGLIQMVKEVSTRQAGRWRPGRHFA